MQPITPMEAYATTDGSLFPTLQEALVHQYKLDIRKEVHDFFGWDGRSSFFDTYTATKVGAVIDWEAAKKMKELKGQ